MAAISMKALLETGVHFGHRTRKWNPRMKPYIFTERNGIHIIDLQQTVAALDTAFELVRDTAAKGGMVLFVGTKRQAQESIQREAERCGMPHINQRWLGGTLTNWKTIKDRINELKKLEERRDAGEFDRLTKKEGLILTREIIKLQDRLGGIRDMTQAARPGLHRGRAPRGNCRARVEHIEHPGHRAGGYQLRSGRGGLRDPRQRRRHPCHQTAVGQDCRRGAGR